jgi:hypothetical protein
MMLQSALTRALIATVLFSPSAYAGRSGERRIKWVGRHRGRLRDGGPEIHRSILGP